MERYRLKEGRARHTSIPRLLPLPTLILPRILPLSPLRYVGPRALVQLFDLLVHRIEFTGLAKFTESLHAVAMRQTDLRRHVEEFRICCRVMVLVLGEIERKLLRVMTVVVALEGTIDALDVDPG